MTDGEIVEIYRAKNEPDAILMESALREHGIKCRLVGQYLAGAVGVFSAACSFFCSSTAGGDWAACLALRANSG